MILDSPSSASARAFAWVAAWGTGRGGGGAARPAAAAALLLLAALSVPPVWAAHVDPAVRLHQADVVASAASAVARARAENARPKEVAALMATYRSAAVALAAMDADAPAEDRGHHAARVTLSEATAAGREARVAAAELQAWLGPLDARLTLLAAVPDASSRVRDGALARSMRLDAADQALAIAELAVYDATQAQAAAAILEIRAASLRAEAGPHGGGGLEVTAELRELEMEATGLRARIAADWAMRDRAEALRALLVENPDGGDR